MAASSYEILHDFSPLFIVYKDGRVERLAFTDFVPSSVDPDTGVQSKDVEIAHDQNISARLYLPKNASDEGHKLPLLVYFHGGGFAIGSPYCYIYHKHLNMLVAEANVVAVSINYKLAPEYPLPIAYEDSWVALKWVASHSQGEGTEIWLKQYADFDRVYLGGDSAGANIVNNMSIRAGLEKLDSVNITGIFLNCPYFGGKEPIGNEPDNIDLKTHFDNLWLFIFPTCLGLDDPLFNPATDLIKLSSLGSKRVLIYVAEKDIFRDRGWFYKESLRKSGWSGDVEVVEVEGEDHVFWLVSPTSDKAIAMLKKLAHFLNNGEP